MYKLAVIGNPIEHSLSPVVFNLFAKQFNLELEYKKILAQDSQDFTLKLKEFFAAGGNALNITSPFKNLAYQEASLHTARSNFCQASNFIQKKEEMLVADTTDGAGLVNDIKLNKQYSLKDKKVLIIGSGYVLDSILLDLIVENPTQIDILARNTDRIDYLANKFGVGKFIPEIKYDVGFNSTPNTPDNRLFTSIKNLKDGAICYDLAYAKSSLFLEQMQRINSSVKCYNGLGMLVMQAQIAFTELFKQMPDTKEILSQLANLGHSCALDGKNRYS
jgi:shikimate dehydrogenase